MIGVCALKAWEMDRTLPAVIMFVVIGLLLLLGNYHKKFKEARQGIWFPHTIVQFSLQQLILFPAGLWLVGMILDKTS